MTQINTQEAPRQDITISGLIFSAPQPFTEGHVLRANEAAVLNQTYAENLRNNFASQVKLAQENATKEGNGPVDQAALAAAFEQYIQQYDFGIRKTGTTKAPVDPVLREAMSMAKERVKDALQKKGFKLKDVGAEQIQKLAEQALEKYPQIMETAKQMVALRAQAGAAVLEELDLGAGA